MSAHSLSCFSSILFANSVKWFWNINLN
jgi:hypothetical protein